MWFSVIWCLALFAITLADPDLFVKNQTGFEQIVNENFEKFKMAQFGPNQKPYRDVLKRFSWVSKGCRKQFDHLKKEPSFARININLDYLMGEFIKANDELDKLVKSDTILGVYGLDQIFKQIEQCLCKNEKKATKCGQVKFEFQEPVSDVVKAPMMSWFNKP